jgi:hypothetical protein
MFLLVLFIGRSHTWDIHLSEVIREAKPTFTDTSFHHATRDREAWMISVEGLLKMPWFFITGLNIFGRAWLR